MRTVLHNLFESQKALLEIARNSAERVAIVQRLTREVPAPLLAHYLRMIDQGRRAVAQVRHGVCSECHLRLPSGSVAALAKSDEVHLCDHCGSYLLPAVDDSLHAARALPTARRAVGRPRATPAIA